jgi:hypothetical protein
VISRVCSYKQGSDALGFGAEILTCQQILSTDFTFRQRPPTSSVLTCARYNIMYPTQYSSSAFDPLMLLRRKFRLPVGVSTFRLQSFLFKQVYLALCGTELECSIDEKFSSYN